MTVYLLMRITPQGRSVYTTIVGVTSLAPWQGVATIIPAGKGEYYVQPHVLTGVTR